MKLLRSSKIYRHQSKARKSYTFLFVAIGLFAGLVISCVSYSTAYYHEKNIIMPAADNLVPAKYIPPQTQLPLGTVLATDTAQPIKYAHTATKTTVFWVGEIANKDNDFIANKASAWDEHWMEHFGGIDDPVHRTSYWPSAFKPQENPFYFALPYNDIDAKGIRKSSAKLCPNSQAMIDQPYSWCKNAWIAVRKGSSTSYAQWQDVGPNEENDPGYVFGTNLPRNTFGEKAGLDVSPAVRDYLHLTDSDTADWTFVSDKDVPAGPWKQIVTTSRGYKL